MNRLRNCNNWNVTKELSKSLLNIEQLEAIAQALLKVETLDATNSLYL